MIDSLVSIITPSYNASRFIRQAIHSVRNQTYANWEMIIVDDGSTDDTIHIIHDEMSHDQRISLLCTRHQGAAIARNTAIGKAQGQYIAFLDSDDVWEKDKLAIQIAAMKKHCYAFTFTSYYVMSEDGRRRKNIVQAPATITYRQYLRNTIIGCLTVVIDRRQTGALRMPIIRSSHDMALWLILLKKGFKAYGLPQPLAGYRMVSTANTANKWKAARDVWRVYREHEHLSLPDTIFNFCGYAYHATLKRLRP